MDVASGYPPLATDTEVNNCFSIIMYTLTSLCDDKRSFYPKSRPLFSFSKKIKIKKSQRGGVSKGISDSVFETV